LQRSERATSIKETKACATHFSQDNYAFTIRVFEQVSFGGGFVQVARQQCGCNYKATGQPAQLLVQRSRSSSSAVTNAALSITPEFLPHLFLSSGRCFDEINSAHVYMQQTPFILLHSSGACTVRMWKFLARPFHSTDDILQRD
jgi:hypothetical protein